MKGKDLTAGTERPDASNRNKKNPRKTFPLSGRA
jgi:hypothetical protein